MEESGLRHRFRNKWKDLIHRASTHMYKAPADPEAEAGPGPGRPVLDQIRHRALVFTLFKRLCLLFGIDIVVGFMVYIVCFWVDSSHSFGGKPTYVVADAFYFSSTTLTTTGYGDDAPLSNLAKTLTSFYIILNSIYINFFIYPLLSHLFQLVEGRGFFALGRVVVGILYAFIAVLIGVPCLVCFAELSWGNAFYTVIVSFSSTGFGGYSFENIRGRIFGSVWLLVSHLVNCRICSMVAEAGDEFVVQKFELLCNSTLREARNDAYNLRRALVRARTETDNLRRGAKAEAERLQNDLDGAKAEAERLQNDLNGAKAEAKAEAERLKHELEAARAEARNKERSLQCEIDESRREVSVVRRDLNESRREVNDFLLKETNRMRERLKVVRHQLEEARDHLKEAFKKPSSPSTQRRSERNEA